MEYPWPGNVRELENVLERGAVCSRGAVLGMEDIADEVREHVSVRPGETAAVSAADLPAAREDAFQRTADDAPAGERELLLRALEEHRWNRGTASTALGIDRSTLWRKMKRLGIG
jgi:transcriptional regulator of acetoin/glycerol metabolism